MYDDKNQEKKFRFSDKFNVVIIRKSTEIKVYIIFKLIEMNLKYIFNVKSIH